MSTASATPLKWLTLLVSLWAVLNVARSSDIIDLECTKEADCANFRSPLTNSTCEEGTCKCVSIAGGSTTCKPIVNKYSNKMGGQCPCILENSYCNEKTQLCICKEGFQMSRERKKCVSKSVPLGKACEIDEQCIVNDHFSHCDDRHRNCTCLNHFAVFEGTCHSVIGMTASSSNVSTSNGSSCEHDTDCAKLAANSTCHEKRCICGTGFVADAAASNCLPVARYEGNCTDSNQCIATLGIGSICHDGRCVCSEAFFPFQDHAQTADHGGHEVRTICKRKVATGSSCNDDKECYQFHKGPHEQLMECFKNECFCRHDTIEKEGDCYQKSSDASLIHLSPIVAISLAMFSFYVQ